MAKYKVHYSGWYIVETDSIDEAMETDRDDAEVMYGEHENEIAICLES